MYLSCVSANEPVEIDPFETPDIPHGVENPNHLEPICPYSDDESEQKIFRALVGTDLGELWMVTTGTGRESAIILRHTKLESGQQPWRLEYRKAGNPIAKNTGGMDELEFGQEAIRREITVSDQFATTLSDAWRAVLVKTRYADDEYRGLDGTSFWFYCYPKYFGTTWSPGFGLPDLLVTLGHSLMDLVNAPEADAARLRTECENIAKKIMTSARTNISAPANTGDLPGGKGDPINPENGTPVPSHSPEVPLPVKSQPAPSPGFPSSKPSSPTPTPEPTKASC